MAVRLPDIVSRVRVDTSGLNQAKQDADQFGDTAQSKFAGVKKAAIAMGAAFVAVKGKQLLSGAIDAASDANETLSKSNTIFKESAAEIEAWGDTAAKSFGQSKTEALDAAATFGNLFDQLDIASDQTTTMSTSMVELASDFASFHNADITQVLEAQTAAFRGEYDAVQRFVPTINAAAVQAKALEMGLAGTSGELTQQHKALATYELLVSGAGEATGDFARTSGSLANQKRILAASMADLSASLGNALLPVMEMLTKAANALAGIFNALPGPVQKVIAISGTLTVALGLGAAAWRAMGLATLFAADGFVRTQAASLLAEGSILRTTVATVAHKVASLASAAAAKAMAAAQWALNAALTANPIGIVIAAIAALVAAIVWLWKNSEGFREAWRKIWDGIEKVFYGVVNGVMAGIETLVNWVIGQLNGLIRAYNKIPLVSDIGELGTVEMRRFGEQGGGSTVNQTININNPVGETSSESLQRELRKQAILGTA